MKINHEDFNTVFAVKNDLLKKNGTFDYKPFKNVGVEFLTEPIKELIEDNKSILNDAHLKLKDCKGILILSPAIQLFYEFKNNLMRVSYDYRSTQQFVYKSDFSTIIVDEDGNLEKIPMNIEQHHPDINNADDMNIKVTGSIVMILGFEMMKQYSVFDFQVIAVNKGLGYKSKKEVHGETFETDFKFPVRIVDCKYVRSLIRSGEYKVRGFFRMQPYGSRSSPTYKLIWIDEHVREKHNILRKEL